MAESSPSSGIERSIATRMRRAYELGRLRSALVWSTAVTLVFSLLSLAVSGRLEPAGPVVAFVTWMVLGHRGGALLRGALAGLLPSLASWLVPLSLLRPCCTAEQMAASLAGGMECCTRPECCLEAGVALGVVTALLLPLAREKHRSLLALGAVAGALGTTLVRCAPLFMGETVGLLGGIAAGIVGVTAGRQLLRRAA